MTRVWRATFVVSARRSPGATSDVGNRVEDDAVAYVIECERVAGRQVVDVRSDRTSPVDLMSGDRLIELKAYGGSARGQALWLEPVQYEAALAEPDRFYLYVVDHVADASTMRLHQLHGERLDVLLRAAKERVHFELPWPVADYDRGKVQPLPGVLE